MIKKEETEMRDTFFVVTTCILFDFFFKNCFHWHIYWRNLIQHWYSVTSIHSCWHYKNKFQKLYTFSLTWKAMIEQFKDSTNGPIEIIVVAIHYKHLKLGRFNGSIDISHLCLILLIWFSFLLQAHFSLLNGTNCH